MKMVKIQYSTGGEPFQKNIQEAHNFVLHQAFQIVLAIPIGVSGLITPLKDSNGQSVGAVAVTP